MAKSDCLNGKNTFGLATNSYIRSMALRHDSYIHDYVNNLRPSNLLGHVRELEMRDRTGTLIPIELKAADLGVCRGERFFGAFVADLRKRRELEQKNESLRQQLEKAALTDVLTELPNRRAFDLEAERFIVQAARSGRLTVVANADAALYKAKQAGRNRVIVWPA